MKINRPQLKVALLLNVIAPSRLALYTALAEQFNLLLLYGGVESNRETWEGLGNRIPKAIVRKAWGFQFRKMRKARGKAFNPHFLHVTPGFVWHLLFFWPEVVISNEMGFRTLIALLYGTIVQKPVWVWWGGTSHTERDIGRYRRAMRFLISRWARNWISYGQTSTNYLITLGVHRNCIVEAQNCVDDKRFNELAEPIFDLKPRPVLLHVGQFIGRKGIDLFLGAAASLQREGHEFSLLLVGTGRDKRALELLAKGLQLKNVYFEPGQDPFKMAEVYRSADVLIFPTLEDVWGLVANEALLCGLPVLCSKYAGCATELFPETNIFDPEDATEFTFKLRDAVTGRLPMPDNSRLRKTSEVISRIVGAIKASVDDRVKDHRRVPADRAS